MPTPPLRCLAGAVCAALLLGAAPARAQHPVPPSARSLHDRLALADVLALATVAEVRTGRILVRDARVLRGEADDAFEIKRSPSRPPPLAVGSQAILLLRGARSPFVLVDEPRELVATRDEAEAARWEEALTRLEAARGDPQRLYALYLSWLDAPSESLRQAGSAALLDRSAPFHPLRPAQALERAATALDVHASPTLRQVSALLATGQSDGAVFLLERLPAEGDDATILDLALRGGVQQREALRATVLRALAHPAPDVRRTALRAAPFAWSPEVGEQVGQLAHADRDEGVRRDAAKTLKRVQWSADRP